MTTTPESRRTNNVKMDAGCWLSGWTLKSQILRSYGSGDACIMHIRIPSHVFFWTLLTPNFGKLFLEKKRSADDVESKKKNLLIEVCLRAGRGIFFKIFGDTWHRGVSHQPRNIIWYILRCITYDLLGSWRFWNMGGHRLWTMELESRQDTCWFHALGIRQAVQWIGSV